MTHTKPTKDNLVLNPPFDPILKWPGGKRQELKHIHPLLPATIDRYYEPFIGGGAVYFSINSDKYFINDKSTELVNLYNMIKKQDTTFFKATDSLATAWLSLEKLTATSSNFFITSYSDFSNNKLSETDLKIKLAEFTSTCTSELTKTLIPNFDINTSNFLKEVDKNIFNKTKRMKKIELEKGKLPEEDIIDNMESALKSAFYMHFRYLYNNIKELQINNSKEASIFFFIRNFAYSGMFRYNKSGKFNVPYGGIGYNRKNMTKKIKSFSNSNFLEHLAATQIESLDFEDFFKKEPPSVTDFIFLDPPYDSEFSTYAKNTFNKEDQQRLAEYLITKCKANWMMVIKNTEFIFSLYKHSNLNISFFDKNYMVSFQNRNDKKAEHIIIRNYQ